MPYDIYDTTSSPPAAPVDKTEPINKAESIDRTKKPKNKINLSKEKVESMEEQPSDDFNSKTGTVPELPEEVTTNQVKEDDKLPMDLDKLSTSEACPGEGLDERMEISNEAASPSLTTGSAASNKQRKTAASEQQTDMYTMYL